MKKLAIIAIIGSAVCASSFGQGYLSFNSGSTVKVIDNFTSATAVTSPGNVLLSILWSSNLGAVPLAGSSGSGTNQVGTWASILTDPNFHFAASSGSNTLATTFASGPSRGTFNGGVIPIDGTAVGDNIRLFVVGWDKSAGLTPQAAAAAGAAFGYSNPITYNLVAQNGTPSSFLADGMGSFVANPVTAVPEPATFALAGLGAAAMLIFRRRK